MNKALAQYSRQELNKLLETCNSLTTRMEIRREIQSRRCPKHMKKAMQVLRRRVRFDGAHLTLTSSGYMRDDTEAIRKATRTYVESWIVPILDAIESGDTKFAKELVELERGHDIDGKEWAQ